MNKSFKKFLMYLLVLITIITFTGPSFNSASAVKMPDVIHETKESEYLASGVLYENIKRFTSKGWWNINLVRVDLTDEYSQVGSLISEKGLSNRDTVKNMVNDNKAVAGVNGDFFNYTPTASSFSELISDGEIISLPNLATKANPAHPTFYINSKNQGNIDFFKRSISVKSLRSNKDFTIGLVNKSVGYNATILLNKHWGKKSFGNKTFKDTVEMVVVNDVVKEIRKGQGPTTIPTNGYIVATSGNLKNNLLNSFKVGDKVKLNMGTTPNLDNIEFAIGGGSIILKDGVPTNIGRINIKGNHPRTGLGISKDGKELLIATIDGRDTFYKGVSQEMFGAILKDLGAYNALNLDGGGSTTMAVKPVDKQLAQVVNKPSDGGERRVVNGVGVYSNAPKGELSYLKVQADDSKMFLNTSRKFSVKGFDQYHNPIKVDQNKITYNFEGVEGEVIGNKFKAKSTGTAKVIAHCGEATGSMNLRVLGEVKSLIASEDKFNLEPNNKKNIGILNGIDENGFKVKIYPEDVEWIISDNIGKVENGVFHSNENIGSGIITGKIGKGASNILVSIGSVESSVGDFGKLKDFKSTTYPNYVKGAVGLSPISKEGKNSISLRYDFTKGGDTKASYLNFAPNGNLGLDLKDPNKLGLWVKSDGNSSWLRGTIRDKNNKRHVIEFTKDLTSTDWQYVEAKIPSNIASPVKLERIYIVEVNGAKKYSGEILLDGLKASYPVDYGNVSVPKPSTFKDPWNVASEKAENGFSFSITKAPKNLNKIAGYNAESKIQNMANNHDLNVFVGGVSPEFRKGLKTNSIINIGPAYRKENYKNILFIDASSAYGGIRSTNPAQWKWLKNDLANTDKDHIILFLNTPIFGNGGFKDPLEANLLHNILAETEAKGKSVWVVHGGFKGGNSLKEGVRYIQLDNKEFKYKNHIPLIDAIEFVVNGKDITYQINSIFK